MRVRRRVYDFSASPNTRSYLRGSRASYTVYLCYGNTETRVAFASSFEYAGRQNPDARRT